MSASKSKLIRWVFLPFAVLVFYALSFGPVVFLHERAFISGDAYVLFKPVRRLVPMIPILSYPYSRYVDWWAEWGRGKEVEPTYFLVPRTTDEAPPFSNQAINPITITNLEQWIEAVPLLRQTSSHLSGHESWVMDGIFKRIHIPVNLKQDSEALEFEVAFIAIDALQPSGALRELSIHSRAMSMDELRPLVTKFHAMYEWDPQEFIAWGEKVGDKSIDVPRFDRVKSYSLGPSMNLTFQVLKSFDDERPWYVLLEVEYKISNTEH